MLLSPKHYLNDYSKRASDIALINGYIARGLEEAMCRPVGDAEKDQNASEEHDRPHDAATRSAPHGGHYTRLRLPCEASGELCGADL